MRTPVTALIAALAILSPGLAHAQAVQAERMQFFDSKTPSPSDKALLDQWAKAGKPDKTFGVLYQTFKAGDQTVTFIVGDTLACDWGPQSIDSKQTWGSCPLTVISTGKSGTKTQVSGEACYAHPTAKDDPGLPPEKNYVATSFDPKTKVVEINTYRDGVAVPECARSLAIQ